MTMTQPYDSTGALAEEAELRFGIPGQSLASALLLLERLSGGVQVTADWLTNKRRPTYRVDPRRTG